MNKKRIPFNDGEDINELAKKRMEKLDKVMKNIEEGEEQKKTEDVLEKNRKARKLMEKLSEPIKVEHADVMWVLKPITVQLWDSIDGKVDPEENKSKLVYGSLLSPELTRQEFLGLPAGIRLKLYTILIDNFFLKSSELKLKKEAN